MSERVKFSLQRERMVEQQLIRRGINDQKVLEVMGRIPREDFVPHERRSQAYIDGPVSIGLGQTVSQPYIVALMTELLELKGKEKVLEIGTGSGYQAAVLSKLAKSVYSIERHRELLAKAQKVFAKLGIKNIETKVDDGSKGWKEFAPYEAVIVTAAAQEIPQALIDQLAEGGRLVAPVGKGTWQRLVRIKKEKGKLKREDFGGCAFVPLIEEK